MDASTGWVMKSSSSVEGPTSLSLPFLFVRLTFSSGLRTYPYWPFSPIEGLLRSTISDILTSNRAAFFL